jgi:hypothetical protein
MIAQDLLEVPDSRLLLRNNSVSARLQAVSGPTASSQSQHFWQATSQVVSPDFPGYTGRQRILVALSA